MRYCIQFLFVIFLLTPCAFLMPMQPQVFDAGPSQNTSSAHGVDEDILNAIKSLLQANPTPTAETLLAELQKQRIEIQKQSSTSDKKTQVDRIFTRSFPSEERQTEEKLIGLIAGETQAIDASIYEFNAYKTAYALCKKHQSGIPIRMLLNRTCKTTTAQLLMKRCGIPIKYASPSGGIMHKKVVLFDANTSKNILFDQNNEKDRSIIEQDPDLAIPLFWTGSFNVTGKADKKNSEDTSVICDELEYAQKKVEFENQWNNASLCPEEKNNKKLATLDTNAIKEDLSLNNVPSANVVHLLRSLIVESDRQQNFSAQDLYVYKDFAPLAWRTNPDYSDLPEILPEKLILPFPCYFYRYEDNQLALYGNDENWYKTDGLLSAPMWLFKDKDGRFSTLAQLCINSGRAATDEFEGPFESHPENPHYRLLAVIGNRKKKKFTLTQLRADAPLAILLQEAKTPA